jgi:hypothetical protein
LRNIFKEQKEQQHSKLQFLNSLCWFAFLNQSLNHLQAASLPVNRRQGTSRNVKERQGTSRNVKERQQTSMDAITILTTLKTAYRFLKE